MRIMLALVASAALVLTGCGGSDSSSGPDPSTPSTPIPSTPSTPTPSRPSTPTPSSTHEAEPSEPTLVTVPGYAFTDLTGEAKETADAAIADMVGNGAVTGGSYHLVSAVDGGEVGILMLFTPSDEIADTVTSDLYGSLLEFYEGMGLEDGAIGSIAGETVVTGPADADGMKMYAWFHEGAISAFLGPKAEARAFMTAYLTAHA